MVHFLERDWIMDFLVLTLVHYWRSSTSSSSTMVDWGVIESLMQPCIGIGVVVGTAVG